MDCGHGTASDRPRQRQISLNDRASEDAPRLGYPRLLLRGTDARLLASAPGPSLQPAAMRAPRLEKLADVLVNYSVGVKKDQVVRLSGPPVAEPLIVELYRKVIAAGGHPF